MRWLLGPSVNVKVAGQSGISQSCSRLSAEPLKKLYEAVVTPIAKRETRGAWYKQWRLMSLDGTTLDAVDAVENEKAFGRPGASRGSSAFPSFVSWPCWNMEPMSCGRRAWTATASMN